MLLNGSSGPSLQPSEWIARHRPSKEEGRRSEECDAIFAERSGAPPRTPNGPFNKAEPAIQIQLPSSAAEPSRGLWVGTRGMRCRRIVYRRKNKLCNQIIHLSLTYKSHAWTPQKPHRNPPTISLQRRLTLVRSACPVWCQHITLPHHPNYPPPSSPSHQNQVEIKILLPIGIVIPPCITYRLSAAEGPPANPATGCIWGREEPPARTQTTGTARAAGNRNPGAARGENVWHA